MNLFCSILALILKSKTRKTWKYFQHLNSKEFVLPEEVGHFWGSRIFDFGAYTEIENLENSEISSTLVNSKECVLLEEVGNSRGFRVFDFGSYTEMENSENSEIFSTLVNPKNVFYFITIFFIIIIIIIIINLF